MEGSWTDRNRETPCPPRTAVVGCSGYLGRALLAALRALDTGAVGTSRSGGGENIWPLDLRAPWGLASRLADAGCKVAVITAAVTGFAPCERDPAGTRAVNVEGVLALCRDLAEHGVTPVYLSSDAVFSGEADTPYREADPPAPATEYGRQKAEVEEALREVPGSLVLRLAKVFHPGPDDGFLGEMGRALAAGKTVLAATDQVVTPIRRDDFVRAVLLLLSRQCAGLAQVCGDEARSRLDLAVAMAEYMHAPRELVVPTRLHDIPGLAGRPRYTAMAPETLRRLGFRATPLDRSLAAAAEAFRSIDPVTQ